MRPTRRHFAFRSVLLAALVLSVMTSGGCTLAGFLAANYQENTPRKVKAEYEGLAGQSFTVVVRADRSILADFPGIADNISIRVNNMLRKNLPESDDSGGTTGYIPPIKQLDWLSNHPRWRSMMPSELGESLQVTRLVVVDLFTFRLHEPGNRYIWNGEASGTLRIFEIDSSLPDDAVFEIDVRVGFPTKSGMTSNDYSEVQVSSILLEWFSRRVSWFMFDHEEKRDIEF